jgi:hypothetical protein
MKRVLNQEELEEEPELGLLEPELEEA